MRPLALALLVVVGARHYGWQLAPVEHQADAWNILGAAAVLVGFGAAMLDCKDSVTSLMFAALGAHEVAVIVASVAYIVDPWPMAPGQAMLSSWAGFELAKLGGLLLILALVKVHSTDHVNNDRC